MQLNECHELFIRKVEKKAAECGKSPESVYSMWREYSEACCDQSALWSEFTEAYRDRLAA